MILDEIKQILVHLKHSVSCDFVGLAAPDNTEKEICWKSVVGNVNSKWSRIRIRYGKGIAGKVFQTGSPCMVKSLRDDHRNDMIEYPMLLAEKIDTAYAVPVLKEQSVWGVLLIGYRTEQMIQENDIIIVRTASNQLEQLINNHSS